MNMGERIKRQHYVPQGYLRRFQSPNSNKKVARIWVVDRNIEQPFNVPIQTVSSRDGFYDSEIDESIAEFDRHGLENLLRIEEEKFYAALEIIDSAIIENRVIPDNAKPAIAWYMYLQFIRTEKFRAGIGTPSNSQHPDFQKLTQIYGLIDKKTSSKFLNVCLSSFWIIYEMVGEQTVFTSDNPVVFSFDSENPMLSHYLLKRDIGFMPNMGMKMVFPIDSKHILVLYDKLHFPEKADIDNLIVPFDTSEAYSVWSTIINNCDRQIYLDRNDGMAEIIKMLMGLDETLKPIRDIIGKVFEAIRYDNSAVSGTRLNSFSAYQKTVLLKNALNKLDSGQ